jgi:glycosyltransferase involved in cell wall biosynthesis
MRLEHDRTMTKQKVLFLSRLAHPHIGGVERHVHELTRKLIARGYEVVVIAEQHDATLPLQEKASNFKMFRIPKKYCGSKRGIWLWMFAHFYLFLTATVVHAHDVYWWYLPFRIVFFWIPSYTTFHGYEGSERPTKKAIRSRKISEFFSKGVICIGAWMKKWYGTHPQEISYGAGDFAPSPIPAQRSAVFIGRLDYDTGILDYIQGVRLLKGRVTLNIYGDGPLREQVEQAIAGFPFLRYFGETRSVKQLLATHRYAFVSRYLGMIEAMQTGRMVFAHWNNPIKRDYLLSFPASHMMSIFRTGRELASQLTYYMNRPDKELKHRQQARLWAKEQQWSTVANKYENLWKK